MPIVETVLQRHEPVVGYSAVRRGAEGSLLRIAAVEGMQYGEPRTAT